MPLIPPFFPSFIKKIFMWFGVLCFGISIIVMSGYLLLPNWYTPEQEVFRLTSPDEKLDVIVTEQEPGAFGSSISRLYVAPMGISLVELKKRKISCNFKSESIPVKFIHWESTKVLQISRYHDDYIRYFNPKIYIDSETNISRFIKLKSIEIITNKPNLD